MKNTYSESTENTYREDYQDILKLHPKQEGKWERVYPFFLFALIGTCQLVGWNAVMNQMYGIVFTIYENEATENDINTIVGFAATMNFLVTCLCIGYTRFFTRPIVTLIGLSIVGASSVLISASLHLDYSVSYYLIHIFGSANGVGNALIGCSAFGYSNYFPTGYSGAISTGLGLSGLLSFLVWMLGRYGIFNNDVNGTIGACWLVNGFSAALVSLGITLAYRFFSLPWVRQIVVFELRQQLKEQEEKHRVEEGKLAYNTIEDEPEKLIVANESSETIFETVKAVGLIIFLFFHIMIITYGTFPGIGPSHFNISQTNRDILTGTFQFGDMVGRYVPNVVPWLLLRKNPLVIAVLLRTVYFVLFLIIYGFPYEQIVLNHFAFQFFIFLSLAFTNGWVYSCCFIRMPEFVKSDIAKARCSAIALLLILLGITLGQWIDYAIVITWAVG